MDRVIPVKSMILGAIGVAIIMAEPFGYWSLFVGLSIAALGGYFTFRAQNPRTENGSASKVTLREELSLVVECKAEAKKSLFGLVLLLSGLTVAYLGGSSELWLLTTVLGFAAIVVGAINTGTYIGCVSRLNSKRQGKF